LPDTCGRDETTSETEFTGLYGLGVQFIDGGAGGLFVKHVSGQRERNRKLAGRQGFEPR
jgi:hypothetical protein